MRRRKNRPKWPGLMLKPFCLFRQLFFKNSGTGKLVGLLFLVLRLVHHSHGAFSLQTFDNCFLRAAISGRFAFFFRQIKSRDTVTSGTKGTAAT